jgi:hypothetical protein
MKGYATDKTRTQRSIRIESAIEELSQVLGSKDEVILAIAQLLVENTKLTEEQRHQVFEEMQRLYGEEESLE